MLEQVGRLLRASNGQIMSQGTDGTSFTYTWGTSDAVRSAYADTYAALDPLRTVDWHFAVDDPVCLERFMPREELIRTRFYKEFLQPLGWHDFVLAVLEKSATRASMFGFTRHIDEPPFGEPEIAVMRLLSPHVRRAAILHGIVGRDLARLHGLAAFLEALAVPVLLFNAQGRCVDLNVAAQRLLAESPTLRLADGRLTAQDPDLRTNLGTAIAASAMPPDGAIAAPLTIGFAGSSARRFAAHVMPLANSLRGQAGRSGIAVSAMFIQEVGALQPLPGEVLVKLYGLTPAETRLLGLLAQGRSLEDTASALGIARTTARTHLQRLFDKTNTSRQSELVRLVLSAFPAPPA